MRHLHIITFFALLLAAIMPANAKPVDPARAKAVAIRYAQSVGMDNSIARGQVLDLTAQLPVDGIFLFAGHDGKGFVMIAKDDCVTPVLACSEHGSFNTEVIPQHVIAWLQGYASQISYCVDQGIPATDDIAAAWRSGLATTTSPQQVSPMLTTSWGQESPYNAHCPLYNATQHSATGCVATAMAQVMNKWQWPAHGRGIVSTTRTSGSTTATYSASLADTLFDWDNMANDLRTGHTSAQTEAVATLMYNAGLAVQMSYGAGSAANTLADGGTGSHSAEEALRNYFYYSPHVTSVQRSSHTDAEWIALLRNEIDSSRPVIYSGRGSSGGHAFVLDGYNTTGMFHVNWGFYGYDDGYYAMGALNPVFFSAGGSFNDYNAAIIGIQPATIYPDNGTTTVSVASSNPSHGTASGDGTYTNYSSTITLTATAASGYHFKMWSDGCRYNPRRLVATGGSLSFTAVFASDVVVNEEQFYYCNDTSSFSAGYGQPMVQEWGIRLPYSTIVNCQYLDRIKFAAYNSFSSTGTCSYTVRIYRGGANPSAGVLVYESPTPVSANHNAWHTLQLTGTDTVMVNHDHQECLWITLASQANNRTLATNPTRNRDGFWTKSNSGNWTYATGSYLGYAYPIVAHFNAILTYPVDNLRVSDTGSSHATVRWSAPSSSQVTDYTVAWGTGLIPELMASTTTADTTLLLTSLQPATSYHVYVKARYAAVNGYSDWQQAHFTTAPSDIDNPDTIAITDTIVVHDTVNYCHLKSIDLQANDTTYGTCAGAGSFPRHSSCQILAIPFEGYQFVAWSDGNTQNPRTVTLTDDITLTAVFQAIQP